MVSLDSDSNGIPLAAASALGAVDAELDGSVVSPVGSPGVSDEDVVLSRLGSVSDGEDGVIELSSAGADGDDARPVLLEDGLVGLDGDGDGSGVDRVLEGGDSSGGALSGDEGSDLLDSGILAGSVLGSVRVVFLSGVALGLGVVEGILVDSTLAGGSLNAVNELLFREVGVLLGSDLFSGLNGANGRESPA